MATGSASHRRAGKRPTLKDIAEAAGVGTATVERVLNDRGMVAPATAEKVIWAARALGARRELPRIYRSPRRVEVLLVESESTFFKRLERAFLRARSTLREDVIIHRTFVSEGNAAAFTRHIETARRRRHGLIVFAPDVPEVAAAIHETAVGGIPVVTLLTHVAANAKLFHVGIDQYAAGRTAAFFLGGFAPEPGPVVVISGRLSVRAHRERLDGFGSVLERRFPHLTIDAVIEGRDEADRTESLLRDHLQTRERPVGIYDTASSYRVIGRLMRQFRLAGETPFIGHEVTPETVALLREGTMTLTMDQHPELHAMRALLILLHEFGYSEIAPDTGPIPFSIVTPENLPETVDEDGSAGR